MKKARRKTQRAFCFVNPDTGWSYFSSQAGTGDSSPSFIFRNSSHEITIKKLTATAIVLGIFAAASWLYLRK